MTTAHEDARGADAGVLAAGERSTVAGIRGLRWWVVVLVALVFALVGVGGDLLMNGEIGIVYTVCFPVGGVLAAVWVRRDELFATLVQPPLLLAVGVPVAVVASGAMPATGGLTAKALAVAGPMINGFPVMALTTSVCLAVGFARSRLQPLTRASAPDERHPEDRRPDSRRPDSRRPADQRPDDGRPPEHRPDDHRQPSAPALDRRPPARGGPPPAARPDRGGKRPQRDEAGERPGPDDGAGVYRVPRPPGRTERPPQPPGPPRGGAPKGPDAPPRG